MAPYTMRMKFINETAWSIEYKTWESYPVDGSPEGQGWSIGPNATVETAAYFSKGGGTDGLFSSVLWRIVDGPGNLFAYARMPASGSDGVKVRIASLERNHKIGDRMRSFENIRGAGDYTYTYGYVNPPEGGWIKKMEFTVSDVTNTYPDASCTLRLRLVQSDR